MSISGLASESSTIIEEKHKIPRNRYFPDNKGEIGDAKTLKVIDPKTGNTELEIKNPTAGSKRISKEGCKLCSGRGFNNTFNTKMGLHNRKGFSFK